MLKNWLITILQLVTDLWIDEAQDQYLYIPYLSGLAKNAPAISELQQLKLHFEPAKSRADHLACEQEQQAGEEG